jgi:4-hydroxy-2-oxoheptanedioate aldolase
MGKRINRCVELLEQDQAIYYDGPHSGHALTHAQGAIDAATWADYMNVGMEHGSFDMAGLAEYMRGMVDAGPTRSGHRTPAVIVEAPVNGIDAAYVRYNAWQFRQILGRGVHGILLCQAETADAVRAFVESCRYPHNTIGVDPKIPSPVARMEGARRAADGGTDSPGRHWHAGPRIGKHGGAGLGPVDRGIHGALRSLAAQPERRIAAGCEAGKPRRRRQLRGDHRGAGAGLCRDRPR